MLGAQSIGVRARAPLGFVSALSPRPEPVAPAIDSALLASELANLPTEQRLVEDEARVVYWARAPQIPWILREIGRLRELTFRAVGEGTGQSLDLDAFDASYVHLFSFDRRDGAIMGAYRLGLSDELAAPRALYTSTLFSMAPALFEAMGSAIEMGRSFVCARYQRSPSGLFLLWKGIGRFLAERPKYRILFGPVSISADYTRTSRELIVDFVNSHNHVHPLARYVRPHHPFARARRMSFDAGLSPFVGNLLDVEEVSSIIADVEPDQKGIPLLLRQYLKLGGKLLGFNVDPRFSGVLDGLILVDLAETEPKILSRYLGNDAARALLARRDGRALEAS
jgi:putative hemolysin